MPKGRPEPVFPVGFDEDALAENLERLPASAEIALREFRKELQRQGSLPRSRLRAPRPLSAADHSSSQGGNGYVGSKVSRRALYPPAPPGIRKGLAAFPGPVEF